MNIHEQHAFRLFDRFCSKIKRNAPGRKERRKRKDAPPGGRIASCLLETILSRRRYRLPRYHHEIRSGLRNVRPSSKRNERNSSSSGKPKRRQRLKRRYCLKEEIVGTDACGDASNPAMETLQSRCSMVTLIAKNSLPTFHLPSEQSRCRQRILAWTGLSSPK